MADAIGCERGAHGSEEPLRSFERSSSQHMTCTLRRTIGASPGIGAKVLRLLPPLSGATRVRGR
jgi:hypothetical protein